MSSMPMPEPTGNAPQRPTAQSMSEQLDFARHVIRTEGQHLIQLAENLDARVLYATEHFLRCQGSVVVTGIGKAGIIGQKFSATLASTGTRSHFLHSAEAVHGDLGRVQADDVVVVLSHSGKTEEVVRLLPALNEQASATIAITASSQSPLGRAVDTVIEIGKTEEVCSLGLAPSTSTTAMLAVCDALALLTSQLRDFQSEDFARYHPGGNLGGMLSPVEEVMRPMEQCRVAMEHDTIREVLVASSLTERRTGAVMLTSREGSLVGIFTDSDLARLLQRREERALDQPIQGVMSRQISVVQSGALMQEAIEVFAERKISELPVVNAAQQPIGLIDITDVVSMLPAESSGSSEPCILPLHRETSEDQR